VILGQPGQPTTLELACGDTPDLNNNDRDSAFSFTMSYLRSLNDQGIRCGLDRNQAKYNLLTVGDYAANICFTNRVPEVTSADYSWYALNLPVIEDPLADTMPSSELADNFESLNQNCKSQRTGTLYISELNPLLTYNQADHNEVETWLANCLGNKQFSSDPPQPYVEGGTAIEFKHVNYVVTNAACPP
jgi:hypothetical protein